VSETSTERVTTSIGAGALLPQGWRSVPLSEVIADAQPGFACGERDPAGVVQLRMNNVSTRGQVDFSQITRVPVPVADLSRFALTSGDILFNNTNSTELVGKNAVFAGHSEPVVYSNHFTRLRVKANLANPDYLSAWLFHQWQSKVFERICNRWIGQSAIKNDKLLALVFPLPPIEEQKRIAAILSEHMAAVQRARAAAEVQLQATTRLSSSLWRVAFQGMTPLSVEAQLRPAPVGWRWNLLSQIARLESGHTPSRYHPEWWGGDVPWLALPDIRAMDGKTAYDTSEHTNEDGLANSSARLLPAGTVCLSRTASVGFVTIMGRSMATSQDFVNWVCGPELEPDFLFYVLLASREYIRSLASGAVHRTVYMPTVKAFRVCIPPIAEQRQIASRLSEQLSSQEKARQILSQQCGAIDELPAVLLRRAFNGEL
jgi:type I restriction enzyme S subunit